MNCQSDLHRYNSNVARNVNKSFIHSFYHGGGSEGSADDDDCRSENEIGVNDEDHEYNNNIILMTR